MKKNDEKRVALKLVNQYADQYKRIEEENRSLKLEITDMKTNLKINKEIIEGLFKGGMQESFFSNKLKEESDLLLKRGENLSKENEQLRQKLAYYEKIFNDSIGVYRDSAESLQNKIFILENAIIKKDNLIISLNKKLNKFYDKHEAEIGEIEREVYIIEPTTSINLIHDDLMLYKQAYENLMTHIKENATKIRNYENELKKLKHEMGLRENGEFSYMETEQGKSRMNTTSNFHTNKTNSKNSMNSLNKEGRLLVNNEHKGDDWMSILKQANISSEEIDELSENSIFTKIIDAIELLNNKLADKNKQMKNIKIEMDSLVQKNSLLNKDNILLSKTIFELKKSNENLKRQLKKKESNNNLPRDYDYLNSSMNNNTSRAEHKKNQKFNMMSRLYAEFDNPSQLNNSYQENLPVLTEGIDNAEKYLTECGEDIEGDNTIEVDKDDLFIDEIKKSNLNVKKANNIYLINNNINNNYTTVQTGKLPSTGKGKNDKSTTLAIIEPDRKGLKKERKNFGTLETIENKTENTCDSGIVANVNDFEHMDIKIKHI